MSRRLVAVVIFVLSVMGLKAQYNTDRLLLSGQIAMDNSDYVVAIQHFNNIIASKPYLYRPWFYRGIAKELLGDFVGADNDLSKAIGLNPYVHQIFSGRAEVRINLKRYADAIADYDKALRLYPDDKGYWFNRAYAYYKNKEETKKCFTNDGWFKTGDMGILDMDGYLYLRGRSKCMILGSNGQNVYPEELEAVINNASYVVESLVIEDGGGLTALIYPDYQQGANDGMDHDQLDERLTSSLPEFNKLLPSYAQLRKIELMPEDFERTPKKSIKRYLYQRNK